MKQLSFEENQQIQKAVVFLATEYQKSGHNPKPVVLHSIKIAMRLLDYGYGAEIIIGALLHDLLEDSAVTREQISQSFGERVAELVQANSFDTSVEDFADRYRELFERTLNAGHDALVIKATDLYDNSFYYHLADKQLKAELTEKLRYFLKISKPVIGKEKVWKELNIRSKQL